MLITTSTFDNAIKSNGRELYVRATIGATTFDYSNIVSFNVEESIGTEELQLGVASCASMELEINNQDGYLDSVTFEDSHINLETGIKTTAGVEYIALGQFNIDSSDKKNKSITLKGYDNMIKTEIPFVDNLSYPATLAQIAQTACTQAGLILLSTNFNNSTYQVAQKFYSDGATCREVLSFVAGASGGFARCTRDGKIEIVWITNTAVNILPDNWINLSVKELKAGPINRLIISKNDGVVTGDHFSIEDNSSITANGEYAITIKDNPLLIDNMEGALNPIFNQINGLSFYPYDMTWQGNPALQALDKIQITNEAGTVFDTLITSQKLIYAGGLKCEMKCAGKSSTARTYSREGTISKKLKYAEITLDKQAAEIALRATKEELGQTETAMTDKINSVEEKITPEAIALTVTESNLYKEYNSVMNKNPLHVVRSATAFNPLDLYNFTSGTLFDVDTLMTVDLGTSNVVYIADIQINDEDVIDFDDPVERLEKAEASINVQAGQIALVVKEDGSVDSEALVAAINISSTKIEQTALNIDLSGYVTFTSLSTPGQTSIDGGNIITNTISFNSLADKPFIPSQYTDSEALAAWEASGYATYIDGTGAYIGNIKANQLLIGGANGSISFNNLVDKPFIPSTAGDVGAISSTYIDANGVFTPQVYATNINVSGGKITANQIDVNTLQTQITAVSQFVYFTGNPINGIGNMTGGSYINYLGIVSNYGIYLNAPNVKTQSGTVATQEWVSSNYTARFG